MEYAVRQSVTELVKSGIMATRIRLTSERLPVITWRASGYQAE